MSTRDQLDLALKDAMRAGDDTAKRTLRMALAAIKLAEVERRGPLDEPALLAILQKEIKSKHETIQDARKANRPDLEEAALAEIKILEKYLPKGLTEDELRALVRAAIQEAGASGPADMGKVMRVLMPRVQGRAPGDQVSLAVKQELSR